jgi:NAD(P)-dependent dehydrogenase (short-subunit alcohol dehydrogenase family)
MLVMVVDETRRIRAVASHVQPSGRGEEMHIKDRVAFVTGGASAIGRATVVALADKGASVSWSFSIKRGAKETVERTSAPDRIVFRACDVTNGDDLAAAVDAALERFGRLDIVANVAGVGDGDLFADDPGDWRRVIDIDLTAVIDSTRLAVRAMRRGGHGGVVVNLASLIGLYPMAAAPVYSAAKAGVVNFTRSLADLAVDSGVRVNAICPELVDTPMALAMGDDVVAELRASGRILAPEEIAAHVVHLIEDDTRAGAILPISVDDGAAYVD